MSREALGIWSATLVLAMIVTNLIVGASIPADIQLPIHWGIDGTADRFAGKWAALALPVGVAAFVSLLFYAMPHLEPKQEGLSRSQGLYLWAWVSVLLIVALMELAVVLIALGWQVPINRLLVAGLGVSFVIIGNHLGKSRRMFLIGIRTPWTLASEEVWIKTHRLAGKLLLVAGAAMVLAAMAGGEPSLLAQVAIVGIAAATLVPSVYSYILWRDERGRAQPRE